MTPQWRRASLVRAKDAKFAKRREEQQNIFHFCLCRSSRIFAALRALRANQLTITTLGAVRMHRRYPRSGITSVTSPASNSTAAEPSAHLSV